MNGISIATYETADGPRAGIILADRLVDAATASQQPAYTSVLGMLEDWERAQRVLEETDWGVADGIPLGEAKLLAPLLYPHTIYCAGANYQDHMDAVARKHGLPPQPSPRTLGVGPFFFLKAPRTIVGPDADIVNESAAIDYEVELAAVIGRKARSVPAAEALDYVAGYTIGNDMSARDRIMRRQLPDSSPFKYDWGSHKNFDGSCPLGPWIVPAKEIGDPQTLKLRTWVNDELRQNSTTAKMIFSLAEQIEALSRFNTLYPGDVILTGTPEGVGAESGHFLASGDVVRVAIERIGELSTRIV